MPGSNPGPLTQKYSYTAVPKSHHIVFLSWPAQQSTTSIFYLTILFFFAEISVSTVRQYRLRNVVDIQNLVNYLQKCETKGGKYLSPVIVGL